MTTVEVFAPHFDPQIVYTFLGVLVLILLNTAVGILRAIVDGEFESDRVTDYMRKHVLPDGGTLALFGLAATVAPEAKTLFFAATATAIVKYGNKLREKLRAQSLIE